MAKNSGLTGGSLTQRRGGRGDFKTSEANSSGLFEWIDFAYSRVAEVDGVASGDGEAVLFGGGGDEAVFDRHGAALTFEFGQQFGPDSGGGRVDFDDVELCDATLEPIEQSLTPTSRRQEEDAVFKLAENDRIDGEILIVFAQPFEDARRAPVWWPRSAHRHRRGSSRLMTRGCR